MINTLAVAFYLLISTYTDIKERIVPDFLTYSFFFIGLIFSSYQILSGSLDIFFFLSVVILTLLFSLFLYKTGAWAGGDVKLFLTISVWTPFNPCLFSQCLPSVFFTFELFLLSAFLILPFAFLKSAYIFIKDKKKREISISYLIPKIYSSLFYIPVVFASYYISTNIFTNPIIFIFLFVYMFLPSDLRKLISFLSLPFLFFNFISFLTTAILILVFTFLLSFYSLSKTLLRKTKSVNDLKEGDITAQTLITEGEKIIPVSLNFKSILKGDFSTLLPKNIFIAGFDANGLENEQISILKEKAKKNLAPKLIAVKESAPFVPFVLLAYILLISLGDFILGVFI